MVCLLTCPYPSGKDCEVILFMMQGKNIRRGGPECEQEDAFQRSWAAAAMKADGRGRFMLWIEVRGSGAGKQAFSFTTWEQPCGGC